MEPGRSFGPTESRRIRPVEFKQIDPKGLSQERFRAEVASGINAIHICVHEGQKAADRKREELAQDVAAIKGSVATLTDLFSADRPPAVKAKMGWKEHLKIAGTIGACLGLFVFLYRMAVALAPAFHDFMLKVQT